MHSFLPYRNVKSTATSKRYDIIQTIHLAEDKIRSKTKGIWAFIQGVLLFILQLASLSPPARFIGAGGGQATTLLKL